MVSLDVGGFCFGIKKSNYLAIVFSHTTTITQRMQIPKPQNSLRFPLVHSKAIYYKLSLFYTTMLKKPWIKEWSIAFGRKRIFNTLNRQLIKKGIKCFKYQGKKEPSKTS